MTEPTSCCSVLDSKVVISANQAEATADVFKALADPVRLRILSILQAEAAGEICACDIPAVVDRSQGTVSHHLSKMVKAGVLKREQRGKWAWFTLNEETLNSVGLVSLNSGS